MGSKLYNVMVFYGGHFMHIPFKSYTSNSRKTFSNVDLENMSLGELKASFGNIMGEFDSLYYKRDVKTLRGGIKLLSTDSKAEMLQLADANKGAVVLFVYHLPYRIEGVEDTRGEGNTGGEGNVGGDGNTEKGNGEGDGISDSEHSCSDEEFNEIRRKSRKERKKIVVEEHEAGYSSDENDEDYVIDDDYVTEGEYENDLTSEEEDGDICYAEPPQKIKEKNKSEIFNIETPAKDIKWRVGLIFANKKQLKTAVRAQSMASGRPYRAEYVVKGKGSSSVVNLTNRTCSCRVWDLTGVPCCHVVIAIQDSRQNPLDFVAHWFKKETYMKTYSYCLEVIRGEEYWEDVEGDTILPPLIVKKLRGRPKRLRRREGWEGGSGGSGKKQKMSAKGRTMHCGICRQEGHNKNACPNIPADYQPPQPKKKIGKKKQNQEIEEEINEELQLQEEELQTGEAEMMDEIMREVDAVEPEQQTRNGNNGSAIKFMPTPSLTKIKGKGCTPTASTPPTTSQGPVTRKAGKTSKTVKPFAAPRMKK